MITLIICVRRAAHVSHEYFETYWRDVHGPLVVSVTEFTRHLLSYRQFHLINCKNGASRNIAGEPWLDFDGIAILSFTDEAAMQAAFAEPRFLNVLEADTLNFGDLANSPFFNCATTDQEEGLPSRHGGVTLFEFADQQAGAFLQLGADETGQAPNPVAVARYECTTPESVKTSAGTTIITASSFTDADQTKQAFQQIPERAAVASSFDRLPVYAVAREHVFI